MTEEEVSQRLVHKGMDATISHISSARKVWKIDGVYMFYEDAASLAEGRATVLEIVEKNRDVDFEISK